MAEIRITKKTRFAEIREILVAGGHNDLVEFVDKEVELLNRKSAKNGERKATAGQLANEGLKAEILVDMEIGKAYSVGEIRKTIECCIGLSPQKVSPLMRQMADSGLVVKSEVKGTTYYTKVESDEE